MICTAGVTGAGNYSRPWGGMSSSWRCPRCPKVVSGQWRLEQHAVTNYFEQASAVRAMEFTPEMAAEFLRTEAKREEEVRE